MSYKWIVIVAIACVTLAFFAWQIFAYRTPEPAYTIIRKAGAIEIRRYPELLAAEVSVRGERYQAINNGFRLLADFIFGNNKSNESIRMTAPVIQQGAKIAMTAPVIQQQAGDGWIVRFIMPDNYTRNTLPIPNNRDITIISVPATTYVVIRFSGNNTDSNIEQHLNELQDFIQKNHIKTTGSPILAFYNPPWILPFLRRNEVFLQLVD